MSFGDIKVTMLGYTGAGKTCYMAAMYAVMKLGISGFNFSEQDLDRDLHLTDEWDALIDQHVWPQPSDENAAKKPYKFKFTYGFKPVMNFEWLDYRGGALSDSSSQADVQTLRNHIQQSSCLLFCISAEDLARPKMQRVRKSRADRMMSFVSDSIQPSENRPFPVVFVITKFDQYPEPNDAEGVVERIKEIFPTFWASPGWLTSVCPVSLGKGLHEDPANGEIDPVNVQMPVIFALFCQLYEEKIRREAQLSNLANHQSNLSRSYQDIQKLPWWKKRIINWSQSTDIEKNTQRQLDNAVRKAGSAKSEVDALTDKLRLLSSDMMQKTFVFLNGEPIELEI
ncbi:MAG: hypothetical protein AAFY76_06550 [Cyanobacteria bacterium J06649_11]